MLRVWRLFVCAAEFNFVLLPAVERRLSLGPNAPIIKDQGEIDGRFAGVSLFRQQSRVKTQLAVRGQRHPKAIAAGRWQKQRQLGLIDAAIAIPHRIEARWGRRFMGGLGIGLDVGQTNRDFQHSQRGVAP